MGETMSNSKVKKKKACSKRQEYQKKLQKQVTETPVVNEGVKTAAGEEKPRDDKDVSADDAWSEVAEEVEAAREGESEVKRSTEDRSEVEQSREGRNQISQPREVLPKRTTLDIEVDGPVGKRRRGKSWVWWVVFAAGILLAAGGICLAFMDNSNEGVEVGVEDNKMQEQDGAEVQESAKEEPIEEKPEEKIEEGKPEEKPKEEAKPQERPAEPVQPIAPRPENPSKGVATEKKMIALTFDDGPSAYTTPRLLDILKGKGVKATFFVLGTMAQRSPDIVRREANDGHEVASHTPYHNQLTRLSFAQVRAEAVEMDRIFTEILGTRPPFTRPPYGAFNATVGEALGQPMVLWSIDPRDWQDRNATVVCSRVTSAARDGAIILVHDIHATTVDAASCIIDTLRSWGYEFVTVSELAASRGVKMANGVGYYSF